MFQPLLPEKIFENANFILHSHSAFLTEGQHYRLSLERSLWQRAAIVLNIWHVVNSARSSAT